MKKIKSTPFFFLLFATLPLLGFSNPILSDRESAMINHVVKSIDRAEHSTSHLNRSILRLGGMSGQKTRHFLNNICSIPETVYLEIGTWKGSTLVSALYGNEATVLSAVGIDNWSEFGNPKREFRSNIRNFIPKAPLKFFNADCFRLVINQIFSYPVNIYFYDGNHSFLSQQLAFTYYNDILDDVFVAIVADWNWEQVKTGTKAAFENLEFTVLYERELGANNHNDKQQWWNGLYIAVIRKNSDRS